MICRYFLDDILKINLEIIINEGNSVTRFSKVALKILFLSDHVLPKDLQAKLTGMKKLIKSNLYLFEYAGTVGFKVLGLKKATARRYIQYLQEFEEYADVLYGTIRQKSTISPVPLPDEKQTTVLTLNTLEKMDLGFQSGNENGTSED